MTWKQRCIQAVGALLIIEFILQIIAFTYYVWEVAAKRREMDSVAHTWAYKDPKFSEIDAEESLLVQEYQSFVGWRTREIHQPYINVDSEGARFTAGNPNPTPLGLPSVYFFGGSAMWGAGHADTTTIPSLIATQLNSGKPRAGLKNYGEIGYGSTQGIIRLELLLKAGKRPAHVIFYDGCNDLFLATLDTTRHETFRDYSMRVRLGNLWTLPNGGEKAQDPVNETIINKAFWKDMIYHIQIVRFSKKLYQFFTQKPSVIPEDNLQEMEKLADIIAQNYVGNIQILEALSKEYQFDYLLFWQPTLFSRTVDDLTPEERDLPDATASYFASQGLIYKQAAQKIATMHPDNFVSLSNVFSGVKEPIFTDSCHVTPRGNELVSQAMMAAMKIRWGLY